MATFSMSTTTNTMTMMATPTPTPIRWSSVVRQPNKISLTCRSIRCQSGGGGGRNFGGSGRGGNGGRGGGNDGSDDNRKPFWYKGQQYEYVDFPTKTKTATAARSHSSADPPDSIPLFLSWFDAVGVVVVPIGILELTTGWYTRWLVKLLSGADKNGKEARGTKID